MEKISQAKYNQYEEAFRREYLQIKSKGIKSIVGTMAGATRYVSEQLISSRGIAQKNPNLIIVDLNNAINDTTPTILDKFGTEVRSLAQTATNNIVNPLILTGNTQLIDTKFTNALNSVIDKTQQKIIEMPSTYDGSFLSDRIWGNANKLEIYNIVIKGIEEGKTAYEIANEIQKYSIDGKGFYNAFRLAYTELTRAYAYSKVQGVREWNSNPLADFKILVEIYLSSTHYKYDICDEIAGIYNPDDFIPDVPHPHCNCGRRQIITYSTHDSRVKNTNNLPENIAMY